MADEIRRERHGSHELWLPSIRLAFEFGRWQLSYGHERRQVTPGEAMMLARLIGGDEWVEHVQWVQRKHLDKKTADYKHAADEKTAKIREVKDRVSDAAVAMAVAERDARAVNG